MNLREQSSIISCEHMKWLAEKERDSNYNRFISIMTKPNDCGFKQVENEYKIQQGWRIGKKNCIYKQPEYNLGEWEKQFIKILPEDVGNSFNIQTKKI
jgi:hypothetical protein